MGNRQAHAFCMRLTGGCWELSAPLLVEPPLELSLFQDSEKRPLALGRPVPDPPEVAEESSRLENARSRWVSRRSDHFLLEIDSKRKVVVSVGRPTGTGGFSSRDDHPTARARRSGTRTSQRQGTAGLLRSPEEAELQGSRLNKSAQLQQPPYGNGCG
ncbi:unnamed protein product [Arctogadus glacialis]